MAWSIDQKDAENHIDYIFNFKTLERRATVDGKAEQKQGKKKLSAAAASGESYAIQIEIGLDRIIIKDAQGDELDTYQRPNPAQPLGRFGFNGEVALKVKNWPSQKR